MNTLLLSKSMFTIGMADVLAYKIWEIRSCIVIIPYFMYKTISGNVLSFFSSQFTWLDHPNIPLGRVGICNYFYPTDKELGESDFKWPVQGDTVSQWQDQDRSQAFHPSWVHFLQLHSTSFVYSVGWWRRGCFISMTWTLVLLFLIHKIAQVNIISI